jgi:hypothetical protein
MAPRVFHSMASVESVLGINSAQPQIFFEWARDYSVGAGGEFHNKECLQELAFQVGGKPTIVNVSIAEHLHPQFAFRVAQAEGGRRFPPPLRRPAGSGLLRGPSQDLGKSVHS